MSTSTRKIGFWNLTFSRNSKNYFSGDELCDLFKYLASLSDKDRLQVDTKNNKAFSIDKFEIKPPTTALPRTIIRCTFKSCKYNHSPNYMSSTDGSERATTKKLDEGEKELTHLCMRLDNEGAYVIAEERKNGLNVGIIIKYLDHYLHEYCHKKSIDPCLLQAEVIASDDFLDKLGKTTRLVEAELFTDKSCLGSEFFNLLDFSEETRDELRITVKAKRMMTLDRKSLKGLFEKVLSKETVVNRIRIHGKDISNMSTILDSMGMKKQETISVDLTVAGIVDSNSIYKKMEEYFTEENS